MEMVNSGLGVRGESRREHHGQWKQKSQQASTHHAPSFARETEAQENQRRVLRASARGILHRYVNSVNYIQVKISLPALCL